MVIKLSVGLLLSLLGMGNLTANNGYKFLFVNNTPYKIRFSVQYYERLNPDNVVVEHRSIVELKSNEKRSIEKFKAVVFDKYIIPLKSIRKKKIRVEIQAKKSIMEQLYNTFIASPAENIRDETNIDEKREKPEAVFSQSFKPGHFTRDETIVVVVGEPTNLFKIRHWQIVPGAVEKEFIRLFPKGRFRFEEYISYFGWEEDPVDEE